MIHSVHIQNLRCIRDVTVSLEPLTVLVGANGAGKSTFLQAINSGQSFGRHDCWRAEKDSPITITLTLENGKSLQRTTKTIDAYRTQSLRLEPSALRESNVLREAQLIDWNGRNLTNAFATRTRVQQERIVDAFARLVPMFRDVHARPSADGQHRLVFQDRWKEELWYEPHQVSDGSILVLCFLLLEYQQPAPDLILIEEPERGLHPYLVGRVIDLLRKLSRGGLGSRPIQVVMATHSADLLEWLEPTEVRFMSRLESDGSTQIESAPTASTDWAAAVREYEGSLGKLWLSGALGGVPGG